MSRKAILLTEGYTNPHNAKTARNFIYYNPSESVAVFDRNNIGKNALELLGVGKDIPVIGSLDEAPGADTLIISVALSGGYLPENMREVIYEAIKRKMHIISGTHTLISEDPELKLLAELNYVSITDLRKTEFSKVVNRTGLNNTHKRLLTVGNDCSVGKMITSVELNKVLNNRGIDSVFAATGQTGILLTGKGIPIDNVRGDYLNGAAEQLILENQDHSLIIIEGQGSIVHPRYSSVSLGLLHGSMPHLMIMCYEIGREEIHGLPGIKIPPMKDVIKYHEIMASIMNPAKFIGFALNGRKVTPERIDQEKALMEKEFGLPAVDVYRHGADELADAVIKELNT